MEKNRKSERMGRTSRGTKGTGWNLKGWNQSRNAFTQYRGADRRALYLPLDFRSFKQIWHNDIQKRTRRNVQAVHKADRKQKIFNRLNKKPLQDHHSKSKGKQLQNEKEQLHYIL